VENKYDFLTENRPVVVPSSLNYWVGHSGTDRLALAYLYLLPAYLFIPSIIHQ